MGRGEVRNLALLLASPGAVRVVARTRTEQDLPDRRTIAPLRPRRRPGAVAREPRLGAAIAMGIAPIAEVLRIAAVAEILPVLVAHFFLLRGGAEGLRKQKQRKSLVLSGKTCALLRRKYIYTSFLFVNTFYKNTIIFCKIKKSSMIFLLPGAFQELYRQVNKYQNAYGGAW